MTYESDPPRLVYTGDPEDPFVQALEAARDDLPNDEQLARMAAAFSPLGGGRESVGLLVARSESSACGASRPPRSRSAAAVGVGATVKLLNPFSFTKTEVAEAPVQESGPSPQPGAVKRPRASAPLVVPVAPSAEEPTETRPRAEAARARARARVCTTSRWPARSRAVRARPIFHPPDMDGPENETALLERAPPCSRVEPQRAR